MSTDRELLELAAKAAGMALYPGDAWRNTATGTGLLLANGRWVWSPICHDGDALRLAVTIPGLNLQWIIAEAWQAHDDHAARCAYVRRAIVRVAFVIGKAMP